MHRTLLWPVTLTSVLLSFSASALVVVGGGGRASNDCLSVFLAAANVPASHPHSVRCADGDPACDADGTVDGVCTFTIAVCANSTYDTSHCTSTGVEAITVLHALDNGSDTGFDPDFQALQSAIDTQIAPPTTTADVCTSTVNIHVRINGPTGKPLTPTDRCRRNSKTLRVFAEPHPLVGSGDSDRLRLTCVPAAADLNGCSASTLFGGTFDRIQKQVFSASCAVGTCHDSESMTGGLLLEPGAAYSNLVDQTPSNGVAAGLGWKRVTAGDASSSFLYHKITNDLRVANDLGKRMPRPPGRPMLPGSLQEIIRLWIQAGAPQTGWVAGTN